MKDRASQKVVVGIAVGLVGGALAQLFFPDAVTAAVVEWIARPLGQLFLRLLFLLAVPVVLSALVVGVMDLDPKSLGRMGLRTLGLTVVASALAVIIGLGLVEWVGPGRDSPELTRLGRSFAAGGGDALPAKKPIEMGPLEFVQMVPDNPFEALATGDMLGVIVLSLLFGFGLGRVQTEGARRLREGMSGLFDVSMFLLERVLRLAPFGIGALLFVTASTLSLEGLRPLASYVLVVLLGLSAHFLGSYSLLLWLVAREPPLRFFRAIRLALETAFATASSSATLPVSLEVARDRLGLSPEVARFVLTAGASMNQNGTALFEGVTVLFLAQVFGVELSLGQAAVVLVICVLGGIGTAGVPGASLPVIGLMLTRVGVPAEALALIFGVDRILDMCRTTLNVAGDLVIAKCVDATTRKGERTLASPREP